MRYHKFNESESLSASNRRRLEDEDEERRNREFDLISEADDDDFDGDDLPEEPEEDLPAEDDEDLEDFGDNAPADDDFDGDDAAEFDAVPTDYDCDAIARAVQGAVDKISAIQNLTIKSFAGSVVVNGNKVDFRVRTSDGEITGISVEDIMPVAQIDSNITAMDSINSILSGEPEPDEEPVDESYFRHRG